MYTSVLDVGAKHSWSPQWVSQCNQQLAAYNTWWSTKNDYCPNHCKILVGENDWRDDWWWVFRRFL